MANVERSLGKRRDWPQLEGIQSSLTTAGSAADGSDVVVAILPDLSRSFPPANIVVGDRSNLPNARQVARSATFCPTTATTASATNNFDWRLNVYRVGVLQGCIAYHTYSITTTVNGAFTATNTTNPQTITLTSTTGMRPGMWLTVDSGANVEYITVVAVPSATTITGVFLKNHANTVAVSTSTAAYVPYIFTPALAIPAGGTTVALAVGSTGSQTFTPASVYGIHVGDTLNFDTTGTTEIVPVTAVTATTVTATFASTHGTNTTVTTNTPANGQYFELQGGDVITLARLSNNVTGLTSPTGCFEVDWVPARILQ